MRIIFQFNKSINMDLFYEEIDRIKHINTNEKESLKKLLIVDEFALYVLQEKLHAILAEYLNTPFKLSQEKSQQLVNLKSFLVDDIGSDHKIKINELPIFIREGYTFLESIINDEGVDTITTNFSLKNLRREKYLNRKKILDLTDYCNKNFSQYVLTMFLHGSCSDMQLTDFSDIDTFIIIKKNTIYSERQLVNFKKLWQHSFRFIYKFDSLQHHVHMFATETDMAYYPYHWLPPQVIEKSTLVAGKKKFHLFIKRSDLLIFRSFLQLTQRFRDKNISNKIYNEYNFKNDISVISLLPTLFLQSLNYDIVKEDSFDHVKIRDIDEKKLFKKLSKIREEWNTSLSSRIFISYYYSYFIRKYYLRFFTKNINENSITYNSKLKPAFITELRSMIDIMSNKITIKINE